jgi:hypothetical protein
MFAHFFLVGLLIMMMILFLERKKHSRHHPPLCCFKEEKEMNTMKTLWSHMVFVNVRSRRVGRNIIPQRTPVIVYGLFNQLFSLFTAIDIAKQLGRNLLVIGNFYVNFNNKKNSVPVSKIINLNSLSHSVCDWISTRQPQPSQLLKSVGQYPPKAISILQQEDSMMDLEIGCCFSFPLPKTTHPKHIQSLRFHPLFYQLVAPFLEKYPTYQVVHYRMESDFSSFFYRNYKFATQEECRAYLHQKYQDALTQHFDPTIPTVVVSHYYKNPLQKRDHDLQWRNLVHFTLSPSQKQILFRHLQLPPVTPIREVEAVIDFILCTTPQVSHYIGCGGSTFSCSIALFRNHQNSFLVQPIKMV